MRPYRKHGFSLRGHSSLKCGARQRKAVERNLMTIAGALDEIGASDEACHKTRLRLVVERAWMIDLLDAAMVHDRNSIGGHHGFRLVMCHVNGGHAKFVMQAPNFKTHLLPQGRVQIGQRLITQQDGGPDYD